MPSRKRRYPDVVLAQFKRGTIARIDLVLDEDETRISLIRLAVEQELRRRERARRRAAKAAAAGVQPPADHNRAREGGE